MSRPPRILVDLDGVLADFDGAFAAVWSNRYPNRALPDPATQSSPRIVKALPTEWHGDAHALIGAPGFYRTLPTIDGAIDGVRQLAGTFPDVWICSTPLRAWNPCVPEKYAWVEEHLGQPWTERLLLTQDKSIVCADVLIDDYANLPFQDRAAWRLVLHDRPYNQAAVGLPRMTWANWREVLTGVFDETHRVVP